MAGKHSSKNLPRYAPREKRRRSNPSGTSTPDYDDDELELLKAMDRYKRETGRMFPTYTEILGVLKKLGWEKAPPTEAKNRAV